MSDLRNRKIVSETIFATQVKCESCGTQTSSEFTACEHCGGPRKKIYDGSEVTVTKELTGDAAARVSSGADTCPNCGSLNYTWDADNNEGHCSQCGGAAKEEVIPTEPAPVVAPVYYPPVQTPAAQKYNLPLIIGGAIAGFLSLCLVIYLIVGATTLHDVPGTVDNVYWSRSAYVAENQPQNDEGSYKPANAFNITPVYDHFDHNQPNIIGQATQMSLVPSTPEVDYYKEVPGTIPTPGPVIGHEPDICVTAVLEGGSVKQTCYEGDPILGDSTYGTDQEPVYVPTVMVQVYSGPTPIFGTPTPVFSEWYRYQTMVLVKLFDLPKTEGHDNEPYWPTASVGPNQEVVNGDQYYQVVIKFDNGKEETLRSNDPSLLAKYYDNMVVTGKFNVWDIFSGVTP